MANEAQVEAKKLEIRRLLEEIAFLSKSDLPTHEYFRRFLELTSRATDAPGGVVWLKNDANFQRLSAIKFADTEFDSNEAQRQSILKVLTDVAENRRPVVVGPFDADAAATEAAVVTNRTNFPFFFAPMQLNNQVVAILHIWLAPDTDPKTYRDFVTFFQTCTGQAEMYLRARRLESLTAESQKLSQLVTLLGEMEGEFDSQKLAMTIVNYGREVVGSDRVCVTVHRREKDKVLAVSGVETVDKKSALVKSLVAVARHALATDGPQAYAKGDQHAENEEISEYFARGNMRAAYVVPLKSRAEKIVGTMIVESTRPDGLNENARKLSQAVAKHAGIALGAAEEARDIPLLNVLRKLKTFKETTVGTKRRRIQMMVGLPILAAIVLYILPWPWFNVSGDCQLMPTRRGAAMTEVQGRIVTVSAREGNPVKKGDVLAQMDDTELQRQLAIAEQDYMKNLADADRYRVSPEDQAPAARRVAELMAQKAKEEADHWRYQIEMTKIRSPIDGMVMTKDLETTVGKVMDRGGVFAEVGDPSSWQIQLQVKESDLYPLDSLLRNKKQPLTVTVMTRGWTEKKFKGTVTSIQEISQLSYPPPGATGNVFYVDVDLENLTQIDKDTLRSGFSGRAKVDCGRAMLGYVVTRKFWDYLRINWFL